MLMFVKDERRYEESINLYGILGEVCTERQQKAEALQSKPRLWCLIKRQEA